MPSAFDGLRRGLSGELVDLDDDKLRALRADKRMLREEQEWIRTMRTKGAFVQVPPPLDGRGNPLPATEAELRGRIVQPAIDPVNGGERLLVEHMRDGVKVWRWYTPFQLAPWRTPGAVVHLPFGA